MKIKPLFCRGFFCTLTLAIEKGDPAEDPSDIHSMVKATIPRG